MESLSDADLAKFLTVGLKKKVGDFTFAYNIDFVVRMFTHSEHGVEEWLKKEKEDEDDV